MSSISKICFSSSPVNFRPIKCRQIAFCSSSSACKYCGSSFFTGRVTSERQISGVFAELELHIIRDRVRSGMANARAKGRKIGRPHITSNDIPASFLRHYPAYKSGRINLSELARICALSRTTVYKYIGLLEQ